MLPCVNLPPLPIVTRWGTWLKAASGYHETYNAVKKDINPINDDAVMVRNVGRNLHRLYNEQDFIEIYV